MDPIFSMLGAVDVFAAILLWIPFSEAILVYTMVFMLAKGFFFLLSSVTSKSPNVLFLILCTVDILTGAALGVMGLGYGSAGAVLGFIGAVRAVSLVKGLYGLAVSLK
jgi:hypothetical protein